jgi:site-specific DNA-cytosine methylase
MAERRLVELYCGIGGGAAALAGLPESGGWRGVGAFDINAGAVAVYRHNFPGHPAEVRLVDSLPAERLAALEADLFWLSPPCQPFTRRGKERHLADPRAATLRAALRLVAACRPPFVALENVAGFETSAARDLLVGTLEAAGYGHLQERLLCPSELGWPNRRPRYYLLAGREPLLPPASPRREARLADLLDAEPEPGLGLDPGLAARYEAALDRVDPEDPGAIASCFTAAYGKSPVRSGSYLRLPGGGLRRLAPREVLRLLGFPPEFAWPPALAGPASRLAAWRLAGNSLSLPAVQAVLASLPASR